MKQLQFKNYWVTRLLASDPGRKRLNQAGKAVISLISSVSSVILILRMLGQPPLTPAIVAGITGMLGIMTVMDDTRKKKKITTLLLGISASFGVTAGSLLAWNVYLVSGLMILIIFSAFYFSRFGSRYFSLGMIGFMTVYFSSFLGLSPSQLPWFYMGIALGVAFAYLYNFIIFKDSAQLLKRSMRSFHIQANLTFELLIETIQDPETSDPRIKKLQYNVSKLREYASNVATDLNAQDVKGIWPGLTTSQLRLYVFDTAMLVATLAESLHQLKKDDAFEADELRELLIRVITSLRESEVLAQNYEEENLVKAQKTSDSLRQMINELFSKQDSHPGRWLYIIRRIESITTHVTNGALAIQQSLHKGQQSKENTEEDSSQDGDNEEKEEDQGLKPSTKKAYQSLIAGTIAIIVGHLISPVQPYWVLLTTFIVQLGTESVGRTYMKGLQRSVGTVIGAMLGFVLAKAVSGHSVLEIILLFVVIFLAFYIFAVSYTLMSLFITLLIAFMYDLLLGGISFSLLSARVIDTIAGAAIALTISAVIFPTKTKEKVSEAFTDYLNELNSYVIQYIRSFRETMDIKELADHAFKMDEKVQAIKDESKPILQRPGALRHRELPRWITIFTAINYYAKHLVASSYQKNFTYPDELEKVFPSMEDKFNHNIETLTHMIKTGEGAGVIYNMDNERKHIERFAPGHNENQGDLIHHLYYVWRINQSILILGKELGAEERDR
ncbi:FUSC family protein [Halobacillus shinanisalinarum]|uniref:FUSC family protein n=1 Tax=Halobacillus shinanisalinarum TaxID=2932258 RepID=A0ABY4GX96_9BACI|nr:FUSC family protein [Halobacillus shinanisalinarum]UOQ92641.1 FUSC family protein [Halobacillus shinanisalinarum]